MVTLVPYLALVVSFYLVHHVTLVPYFRGWTQGEGQGLAPSWAAGVRWGRGLQLRGPQGGP